MNLNDIGLIARTEFKIIARSIVFRLFSAGILAVIVYLHLSNGHLWGMTAHPCFFPLYFAGIYNRFQSLIILIIGGQYLYHDARTDSTQALLVRPFRNTDYFTGKLAALFLLCTLLATCCCVAVMYIHIFVCKTDFNGFYYLFYLLTLTWPSFLFIAGIATVVKTMIRSKITALLCLFLICFIGWRYLPQVLDGTFDFTAKNIPNTFSDFTGHAGLPHYLLQRLSFVFYGAGLCLLAILRSHRATDRSDHLALPGVLAIILLSGGLLCGYYHHSSFRENRHARARYLSVYRDIPPNANLHVIQHYIVVHPQKDSLYASSQLRLENQSDSALSALPLFLNPGLKIYGISGKGSPIAYRRTAQALVVDQPLSPHDSIDLELHYAGPIDPDICYLSVPDKQYYNTLFSEFHFGRQYCYLSEQYTLLTPECLWYPVCQLPTAPVSLLTTTKDYSDFTLKVIHPQNLTAISQGYSSREKDTTTFIHTEKISSITLCIGDYEQKSLCCDSVTYRLYYLKSHKELTQDYKSDLSGVIEGIRETRRMIENYTEHTYPYRQLQLTEVPLNFTSYLTPAQEGTEFTQPELVLYPELMYCRRNPSVRKQKQFDRRNNPQLSEENTELFFISNLCLSHLYRYQDKYNITSLFTGQITFVSPEFPGIDLILKTILQHRELNDDKITSRIDWRINEFSAAKTYLEKYSLYEIFKQSIPIEIVRDIIELKATYLQNSLCTQIPRPEFFGFLQQFIRKNNQRNISYRQFCRSFYDTFGLDLWNFTAEFYRKMSLPTVYIAGITQCPFTGNEKSYQVRFYVYNPSSTESLITASLLNYNEEPLQINYFIPPHSCRLIRENLPFQAECVIINTHISQNIPAEYVHDFKEISPAIASSPSGIFEADSALFQPQEDEIIVDDTDQGFRILNDRKKWKIPDYLNRKNNHRPTSRWAKSISSFAFGKTIRSFYWKMAHNERDEIEWEAQLPEDGLYEVFLFNVKLAYNFGNPGGKVGAVKFYDTRNAAQYYTIFHQEGEEEIVFIPHDNNRGWISAGKYYFSKGTAKIRLQGKSDFPGQILLADAVKWVKIK